MTNDRTPPPLSDRELAALLLEAIELITTAGAEMSDGSRPLNESIRKAVFFEKKPAVLARLLAEYDARWKAARA